MAAKEEQVEAEEMETKAQQEKDEAEQQQWAEDERRGKQPVRNEGTEGADREERGRH